MRPSTRHNEPSQLQKRGQALEPASLCAALTAYPSVRFLMRYFETRILIPFAIWCLAFGAACSVYFLAT